MKQTILIILVSLSSIAWSHPTKKCSDFSGVWEGRCRNSNGVIPSNYYLKQDKCKSISYLNQFGDTVSRFEFGKTYNRKFRTNDGRFHNLNDTMTLDKDGSLSYTTKGYSVFRGERTEVDAFGVYELLSPTYMTETTQWDYTRRGRDFTRRQSCEFSYIDDVHRVSSLREIHQ